MEGIAGKDHPQLPHGFRRNHKLDNERGVPTKLNKKRLPNPNRLPKRLILLPRTVTLNPFPPLRVPVPNITIDLIINLSNKNDRIFIE